jgi:hypothetical protein
MNTTVIKSSGMGAGSKPLDMRDYMLTPDQMAEFSAPQDTFVTANLTRSMKQQGVYALEDKEGQWQLYKNQGGVPTHLGSHKDFIPQMQREHTKDMWWSGVKAFGATGLLIAGAYFGGTATATRTAATTSVARGQSASWLSRAGKFLMRDIGLGSPQFAWRALKASVTGTKSTGATIGWLGRTYQAAKALVMGGFSYRITKMNVRSVGGALGLVAATAAAIVMTTKRLEASPSNQRSNALSDPNFRPGQSASATLSQEVQGKDARVYTVQKGDWLSKITRQDPRYAALYQKYADDPNIIHRAVFAFNADRIAAPSLLAVGDEIIMPSPEVLEAHITTLYDINGAFAVPENGLTREVLEAQTASVRARYNLEGQTPENVEALISKEANAGYYDVLAFENLMTRQIVTNTKPQSYDAFLEQMIVDQKLEISRQELRAQLERANPFLKGRTMLRAGEEVFIPASALPQSVHQDLATRQAQQRKTLGLPEPTENSSAQPKPEKVEVAQAVVGET